MPDLSSITKRVPLASIHHDPANVRTHGDRNLEAIANSLRSFGQVEPLIVQKSTGKVIGGNGRLTAMQSLGWAEADVVELDIDDTRATALGIALNRTAELAEWDDAGLAALLQSLPTDAQLAAGWDDSELDALLAELNADKEVQEDEAPAVQDEAVTRTGDVWLMGEHRVLCGDSMVAGDVALVMNGDRCDLILTDPPYCSGGFQESGRAAGSVGTDADHSPIVNDRLSTRGYAALLKAAFSNANTKYIYAFTDWRMWVHLFDLAESCGFGVRSMIVWDKGSPGMGRGWRCQHELILWGCKATAPFDKHASGHGNVLACKRTGNENHTTEKPVMLLGTLMATTPFAESVYDPFLGSGTTLIAAEQLGRRCYGIEIAPVYVDVIVRRWQNFTKRQATLEATGQSFAEVAEERGVPCPT